jgi:hypothetical protein
LNEDGLTYEELKTTINGGRGTREGSEEEDVTKSTLRCEKSCALYV